MWVEYLLYWKKNCLTILYFLNRLDITTLRENEPHIIPIYIINVCKVMKCLWHYYFNKGKYDATKMYQKIIIELLEYTEKSYKIHLKVRSYYNN